MKNPSTFMFTTSLWQAFLCFCVFLLAGSALAQNDQQPGPNDLQPSPNDPSNGYMVMSLSGDVPSKLPAFNLTTTMHPSGCVKSSCFSRWTINQNTRLVNKSGKGRKIKGLFANKEYQVEWIATDSVQPRLITQIKLR